MNRNLAVKTDKIKIQLPKPPVILYDDDGDVIMTEAYSSDQNLSRTNK